MKTYHEFEVWVDRDLVACCSAAVFSGAYSEAQKYAREYSDDGEVNIRLVTRESVRSDLLPYQLQLLEASRT